MLEIDTTEYEKSVDEYVNLVKNAFIKGVKQVMVGTADALVENTPVGDVGLYYDFYLNRYLEEGWDIKAGMLMANWYFELNAIDGLFDSEARDADGSELRMKLQEVIQQFKLGDSILVANETPYAENIENGKKSKQAPFGMIAPTELALMKIYKIQFKDFLNG